jgi:hypothetical protein
VWVSDMSIYLPHVRRRETRIQANIRLIRAVFK